MRQNNAMPELKWVPLIPGDGPDEIAFKAAMNKTKKRPKPGTKLVSSTKKHRLAVTLAGKLKQEGREREFTPNYVLEAFWNNDWRACYGTAARYARVAADFIKIGWALRNDDPIQLHGKSPQGPAVKLTTVNQAGNEESVQWLTASDALHLAARLVTLNGPGEVLLHVRVKHPIRG